MTTLVVGPDNSAFYVDDSTLEPTSCVFYAQDEYDTPDVRRMTWLEWKRVTSSTSRP